MTELKKVLDQELENVTGGQGGSAVIKTVANLNAEYLPLRTVPVEKQENEIQGSKLHNGDTVVITGAHVQGRTSEGKAATYVWVYVPKTGVSGYVNAQFLS